MAQSGPAGAATVVDWVATDTAFCGGRWPADLVAEMDAAAATATDA
jgi:hypothetical protein